MADVTVANTSPGIAGKTLACHDADGVTTGLWTLASPLALKSGPSGSQTWRLSVAGSGNLNVLADGTGLGLVLSPAGSVVFSGDISEQGRATPLGYWTTVPFNAANFAGSGSMTWTVEAADQIRFAYILIGKMMTVAVFVDGTTIGGTPSTDLLITIPAGKLAAARCFGSAWIYNTPPVMGFVQVQSGNNVMQISRPDVAVMAASTNATAVGFTFTFEVL